MAKKNQKSASVLVFSLIILFIMTAIALGIVSVSVVSRKMAGTTGKSVGSFQVADSGVEIVLQKIYKRTTETAINQLGSCGDSILSGNIGDSTKTYSVTFYDDASPTPNQLTCNDDISKIAKIKSVGEYGQTSRAVEVAVAAGGGGCYVSYSGGCLTGFTNKGSAGDYGICYISDQTAYMLRPNGASCFSGWTSNIIGVAAVCCM